MGKKRSDRHVGDFELYVSVDCLYQLENKVLIFEYVDSRVPFERKLEFDDVVLFHLDLHLLRVLLVREAHGFDQLAGDDVLWFLDVHVGEVLASNLEESEERADLQVP